MLSICVPSGAFELAREVAARNFRGIYIDANAIAPAHSREIGDDGRDSGRAIRRRRHHRPPAHSAPNHAALSRPGRKRRRSRNSSQAARPTAIPMEGAAVGAASAIKVCFAAYNKGETALLGIIRALAKFEGVDEALMKEWAQSQPGAAQRSDNIAARAFKAWRWAGEMEEIAASFDDAGLPSGFLANAEIYRRLASFKDCAEPPSIEEVSQRTHQLNASTHHSRLTTAPRRRHHH